MIQIKNVKVRDCILSTSSIKFNFLGYFENLKDYLTAIKIKILLKEANLISFIPLSLIGTDSFDCKNSFEAFDYYYNPN